MDDKLKSNIAVRAAYGLLFLMFFYPLSVRPLIWLANHELLSDSTAEFLEAGIYSPLGLLLELEVPVVAPLLQYYIDIWHSYGPS